MHTKPISTEVIASYKATLTSGFAASTRANVLSGLIPEGERHPTAGRQSLYEKCHLSLKNIADSPKESVSHVKPKATALKLSELSKILKKSCQSIEDVSEDYDRQVIQEDHNPEEKNDWKEAMKKHDEEFEILFQIALLNANWTDLDGKYLVCRKKEIMSSLIELGYMEEDFSEYMKDFFTTPYDDDDPYFDPGTIKRDCPPKKYEETITGIVCRDDVFVQLTELMRVTEKEDFETQKKIHRLMLPFLLVGKQRYPGLNHQNFKIVAAFYKTLEAADVKASEMKAADVKASEMKAADVKASEMKAAHVDESTQIEIRVLEDEITGALLTVGPLSKIFDGLAVKYKSFLPPPPSPAIDDLAVKYKSVSPTLPSPAIDDILYDYHITNKRFAAMYACGKLATCFNRSDAMKLYEDIYDYQAFVEQFERSDELTDRNRELNAHDFRLINDMTNCIKASKRLILKTE